MTHATPGMNPESIRLNDTEQIEKGKYHMISLTCRIQSTELIDGENTVVVARG